MKQKIKKFLLLIGLIYSSLSLNAQVSETKILVLFNTKQGSTFRLAEILAQGIEEAGAQPVLKQIPNINQKEKAKAGDAWAACLIAKPDELNNYAAIAFGSPVHFGNMSADMRHFLDQTIPLWTTHQMTGTPATVFMSGGSGSGNEAAFLSFWNTLAIHGMIIVPTGIMGTARQFDTGQIEGGTPFGASSMAGVGGKRPSDYELNIARLQGKALARAAIALQKHDQKPEQSKPKTQIIEKKLQELGIILPNAPAPVGNYKPYVISGKQVYINQVALQNGKIMHKGMVPQQVNTAQAKAATKQTLLNVLAVLKQAAGGNLDNIKQCVQLTGFFYSEKGFTQHADIMNAASDLLVEIFGDKGKHARATIGAASLPLNSPVELQAIFELK